ncbi:MAG: RNA polymerase subunit sigma-70 [Deltaproteobacteria bacterium]|nr:RNA polymerase subunit sigma-70 [Deltaproteobacteria bacterium]
MDTENVLAAAQAGDEGAFRSLVEPHRRAILAHCYRMSGSLHDAEDLTQESLLRAWKGLPAFEQRASVRTWLFKVATRVCLDEIQQRPRRALPMDFGPANEDRGAPLLEPVWIEPSPAWMAHTTSPEAALSGRQSVKLAFLVALQRLPPRQRAVLLLRDVLGYDAKASAAVLDMTVAAVTSALQRARDTLALPPASPERDLDDVARQTLEKYVSAWQHADVEALVGLLQHDAVLSMPPLPSWVSGAQAVGAALVSMVLPPDAAGRFRLVATEACGGQAFFAYEAKGDVFVFSALHVIELREAAIQSITAFVDPSLAVALGAAPTIAR